MKLVENGSDDVSMNGDESAIRPRPCRTYAELDEQEWPQPRARRRQGAIGRRDHRTKRPELFARKLHTPFISLIVVIKIRASYHWCGLGNSLSAIVGRSRNQEV